MKAAILVLSCLAMGACAGSLWGPAKPRWPDQWKASWVETFQYQGLFYNTTGWGLYDFTNGHLTWSRENSTADSVCSTSVPLASNTPCTHIVSQGSHYLFTPQLSQCCVCCSAAEGCGVPPPTLFSNFTYVEKGVFNGQKTYEWVEEVDGYAIVYYETTEWNPKHRSWVALSSALDSYPEVWDFQAKVAPSDFTFPEVCSGADYCPTGVCAQLRGEKTTHLRASLKLLSGLPILRR